MSSSAEVRLDRGEGRVRLERESGAHPAGPDLVEQRLRVAELDVHGAAVGAGVGEQRQEHLRVVDHQVAVEEQVRVRPQRLHDRRPDRQVRHVVAVHAVDVQQVGGGCDPRHVVGEMGEVGSEDRGRNLHGSRLAISDHGRRTIGPTLSVERGGGYAVVHHRTRVRRPARSDRRRRSMRSRRSTTTPACVGSTRSSAPTRRRRTASTRRRAPI